MLYIRDKVKTLYVQTPETIIYSGHKGVIVEVAKEEYKVDFGNETIYIRKEYVEKDNS